MVILFVSVLFVLGLIAGSFANALIWRVHEQGETPKPSAATQRKLSLLHGRSMCPKCRHQLGSLDLIPVFSWLILKRRCRYCHQPISWQYPIVELVTASLFVGSYVFWLRPWDGLHSFEFILWLIFLVGFVVLAVYDMRWFLLPNRIIYPLVLLAAFQTIVVSSYYHGGLKVLVGHILGALILAGTFYILFQLSQGTWIGGGDVKLGVLLGLIVGGPLAAMVCLFIASASGSVVSLPLVLTGRTKRSTHIPFGPFLIMSAIIVQLFGIGIISWFKRLYI